MTSDLPRRATATNATIARYRPRAWSWEHGVTCVHLFRFHARKMGHRPAPLPRLRSLVAARRALRQRGWASVTDMLDAQPYLQRIPPAMMLIGDVATIASEDGIGSIVICAGGKMLGWHDAGEDVGVIGLANIEVSLDQLDGSWRL